MTVVALVFVLAPLLKQGRRAGPSRAMFVLALGLALVLPLTVAGIYALVGTPAALRGVEAQATMPQSIDAAVAALRAHLVQEPDDQAGWMLLGQTGTALRNPSMARDAYDHVLKLDPNNAGAMVGWAESDSMLREDHMIEGRGRELLLRAVQLQPDSQRGLWLLGISDFQQGRYADAEATWRLLQPQLEPGSSVAQAVAKQIEVAAARAASAPAPATSTPVPDRKP